MYLFLIIAQVAWPLFVPFAVLLLEREPKRRKILLWFAVSGIIAAAYFIYCLCYYNARIVVNPYHIQYSVDFPLSKRWFYGIIYFIPAMAPTFFSSIKRMRLLGVLLLASYVISRFWYKDYIVSVWCFFGALSSITVFYIIKQVIANERNRGRYVAGR